MHLLATALLVIALWTVLAIPIAVFVGWFLHTGAGLPARETGSARDSFGRAA
jgi:hypothetical protein